MMPLNFGGSHGFRGEAEGEISHHGGGGNCPRNLRNHLVFKGGRGDQSQLTEIKDLRKLTTSERDH